MKIKMIVFSCGITATAGAYNLEGHAFFTSIAFQKSIISNLSPESKDLYFRLGFDRLTLERPFNQPEDQECTRTTSPNQSGGKDHYIDAEATWQGQQNGAGMLTRCPTLYEQRSMPPQYTG